MLAFDLAVFTWAKTILGVTEAVLAGGNFKFVDSTDGNLDCFERPLSAIHFDSNVTMLNW